MKVQPHVPVIQFGSAFKLLTPLPYNFSALNDTFDRSDDSLLLDRHDVECDGRPGNWTISILTVPRELDGSARAFLRRKNIEFEEYPLPEGLFLRRRFKHLLMEGNFNGCAIFIQSQMQEFGETGWQPTIEELRTVYREIMAEYGYKEINQAREQEFFSAFFRKFGIPMPALT